MSVTYPKGFVAAGVAAAIKSTGAKDLALVVNVGPIRNAAARFTSNRVKAAPVLWSQQAIQDGRIDAVILNSGGANACTGSAGFLDTHRTAEFVANLVGSSATDVAVCSTGLIGMRLPLDRLLAGAVEAQESLSSDGGLDAATAIMTTDTVAKTAIRESGGIRIAGMAKGAGMLAPSLATMLVVITTDAIAAPELLDLALGEVAEQTFNRIDSDGCMSTNDTVLLLASGSSGITATYADFKDLLFAVCQDLAMQLIADAEGASKEIAIKVVNAASEDDATAVGRSCARNNLLKCALHGEDPNWGRVLAAVGTTDAIFDPNEIDVEINGVMLCRGGAIGDDRNLVDMSGRSIDIVIDLHAGDSQATIWTNDLTAEYVHENSAYSS
ncbi:MAG TPA: bifunctional glutamate N-acetyltransferase/amino-acid acetyltransferase ArgJ [Candidatus Nanopelagicaceae bacterium]|nr:bifunctional glutamate N-acetyltransferase/amino-acid acetyltransferase ArgJ [Candidatus Nanopelagicaceae bacterium]